MKHILAWLLLAAAAIASPHARAEGLQVVPCGERFSRIPLADPDYWRSARTFYNGRLRLYLYLEDEPVCCSDYIAVVVAQAPGGPTPGDRCHVVTRGGVGFGKLAGLDRITSHYDPSIGLTLSFGFQTFDPERSVYRPGETGTIRVNMATREVSAW